MSKIFKLMRFVAKRLERFNSMNKWKAMLRIIINKIKKNKTNFFRVSSKLLCSLIGKT